PNAGLLCQPDRGSAGRLSADRSPSLPGVAATPVTRAGRHAPGDPGPAGHGFGGGAPRGALALDPGRAGSEPGARDAGRVGPGDGGSEPGEVAAAIDGGRPERRPEASPEA